MQDAEIVCLNQRDASNFRLKIQSNCFTIDLHEKTYIKRKKNFDRNSKKYRDVLSRGNVCFSFAATPTLIPTSLPSLQPATLPLAHLPQHLQTATFPPTMMSAPLAAAAPRPTYFPQIVYWYPSPPISPQTYVTHTGPPTLVVMRGLPVNAQVQDILNFFQGFPEVCLGPISISVTCKNRISKLAIKHFIKDRKSLKLIIFQMLKENQVFYNRTKIPWMEPCMFEECEFDL
jgi:hypothetical protein